MTHQLTIRARKRHCYHQRKSLGLCVGCGKVPPRPEKTTCAECGAISVRRQLRHKARIQPSLRMLRICLNCKSREAMKGRRICGACSESEMVRQQERRVRWRAEGRCPHCGKPRDQKDRSYCSACRSIHNGYAVKRKQKGLCRCGGKRDRKDRACCAECREAYNRQNRARRAKNTGNGGCTRCGKPLDREGRQCVACRDFQNNYRHAQREKNTSEAA